MPVAQAERVGLSPSALAGFFLRERCEAYLRLLVSDGEREALEARFGPPDYQMAARFAALGAPPRLPDGVPARDLTQLDVPEALEALRELPKGPSVLLGVPVEGTVGTEALQGRIDAVIFDRTPERLDVTVVARARRGGGLGAPVEVALTGRLLCEALTRLGFEEIRLHGALSGRDEALERFDPAPFHPLVDQLLCGPASEIGRMRQTPLNRTRFHLGEHCQHCPFNPLCVGRAWKEGDLALIPGLPPLARHQLWNKGVVRVEDLARRQKLPHDLSELPDELSRGRPPALIQRARAVARTRAGEAGGFTPFLLGMGRLGIPAETPDTLRVILDAQVDDRTGRLIMAGAWLRREGRNRAVVQLAESSPGPELERELLNEFLDLLVDNARVLVSGQGGQVPLHLAMRGQEVARALCDALDRHPETGAWWPELFHYLVGSLEGAASEEGPQVTLIGPAVRRVANIPTPGTGLYATARALGFDWEPFDETFRTGCFDDLPGRGDSRHRARFSSHIPLAYFQGAWQRPLSSESEPSSDEEEASKEGLELTAGWQFDVHVDELRRFEARRLSAMGHVLDRLPRQSGSPIGQGVVPPPAGSGFASGGFKPTRQAPSRLGRFTSGPDLDRPGEGEELPLAQGTLHPLVTALLHRDEPVILVEHPDDPERRLREDRLAARIASWIRQGLELPAATVGLVAESPVRGAALARAVGEVEDEGLRLVYPQESKGERDPLPLKVLVIPATREGRPGTLPGLLPVDGLNEHIQRAQKRVIVATEDALRWTPDKPGDLAGVLSWKRVRFGPAIREVGTYSDDGRALRLYVPSQAPEPEDLQKDPLLRVIAGPNPFRSRIVPDPWQPEPDARQIHAGAFDQLTTLLDRSQRDGQTRRVVLTGESGVGKSHLIRRLRTELMGRGYFVYVDPHLQQDRLFSHLRLRLVESLWRRDGRRRRPLERMIDRLIRRAFAEADMEEVLGERRYRQLLDDIRSGRFYLVEKRLNRVPWILEQYLGEPARAVGPDALRALALLRRTYDAPLALDWLKGADLDDRDLAELGLGPSPTTEDASLKLIEALAALSDQMVVVCYDQTESLPPGGDGRADIGHLVSELHYFSDELGILFLVSALKDSWRTARPESPPDGTISLGWLGPEEGRTLVEVRVREALRPLPLPRPGFPFEVAWYDELLGFEPLSAREILTEAAGAFERIRANVSGIEQPTDEELGGPAPRQPGVSPVVLGRRIMAEAVDVIQREIEPASLNTELCRNALEVALRWVEAQPGLAVEAVERPEDDTVSLAFRQEEQRVGIAILLTQNGQRFATQIKRLVDLQEADEYDRLLVLRSKYPRGSWKAGRRHLRTFLEAGGGYAALAGDTLTFLQAIRRISLDAREGKLRGADGKALSLTEVGDLICTSGALERSFLGEVLLAAMAKPANG